jgi:hypothetical protein
VVGIVDRNVAVTPPYVAVTDPLWPGLSDGMCEPGAQRKFARSTGSGVVALAEILTTTDVTRTINPTDAVAKRNENERLCDAFPMITTSSDYRPRLNLVAARGRITSTFRSIQAT